ncbi:MAG: hypothetical protein PHH13_05285 [Candidatus Peribacteraceae bacterium]|nr:hypothetical protein [Candidatus Peribacteraceae bacterium]
MKSPTHSPLRYGLLAVALLAIVAVELQVLSRPAIPRLPGASSLLGQVFTPVNVFTKAQSEEGIILKKDEHNIFKCPSGDPFSFFASSSLLAEDQITRFWSYEYKGGEPPFLGRFFISRGEYAANDQDTQEAYNRLLKSNGSITEFQGGTTYYVMSEKDLSFKCSTGLDVAPGCGNSRVDPGEQCDNGPDNGAEGADCSAECQLVPYTITLTGRVVDQITQQGLSGAWLQSSYEFAPQSVVTDAHGNFSMTISTDFKLTEPGSQAGTPNISGGWSFGKDCYDYASFSIQRNNTGSLELTKYPFDAELITVPFGSLREVDIGDLTLYPAAHLSTTTDIPASMQIWYSYKHLEGRNGAGNDKLSMAHFISNALPLDYDAQVEFIDEQNQTFSSSTFHIPADAFCQTVNLKLLNSQSQWSICGNGVMEGDEQCDNGALNGTEGNTCMASCRLIQTIQIEGRLINQLTQQAISKATIASAFEFSPKEFTTGADGRFSFSVKTDFRFKNGGPPNDSGGDWHFVASCVEKEGFSIYRNNVTQALEFILRPFDAENVIIPLGSSQQIDIGDIAMSPRADLAVKTDAPMIIAYSVPLKNRDGAPGSSTKLPYTSRLFWQSLPSDYDVHVQLTDASGLTTNLAPYHVPPEAMCKTVYLSYANGQSLWSICGNGIKDGGEECEADSDCAGASSCKFCSCSLCGNGSLDAGEECDDANVNGDDGCDENCQLEPGFACVTPAQPCEPVIPTLVDSCVKEGDYGPVIQNAPTCCVGLTQISNAIPGRDNQCIMSLGSFLCAKCGDGLCGAGENRCNCKADCPMECLLEGETGSAVLNSLPCCEGLKGAPVSFPGPEGSCSVSIMEQHICIRCGNGECGKGENRCNCPEDCPSACIQDAQIGHMIPPPGEECCEGLTLIPNSRPGNGDLCVAPNDGSFICAQCGNGICNQSENRCNCPTDCAQQATGNLFVSTDTTPVPSRQLLGGEVGGAVMRLRFRAENEPIDVTDIQVTSSGSLGISIDSIELYKVGESQPFAVATSGGCGPKDVPTENINARPSTNIRTFCAPMQSSQLVIQPEEEIVVLARPRIKTDVDGAVSNELVWLYLDHQAVVNEATGSGSIHARGGASYNALSANDGDTTGEGEIFIGTASPAPNSPVAGLLNRVVLSKIISIENAYTTPDGTAVPRGISDIAKFRFTAATNTNTKNGINKAVLSGVIFIVEAANVLLDAQSFVAFNETIPSSTVPCAVYDGNEYQQLLTTVSGHLFVVCGDLRTIATEIASGDSLVLTLQANIINPNTSSTGEESGLRVSLADIPNHQEQDVRFGFLPQYFASHLQWIDMDNGASTTFNWLDSAPLDPIYGPLFRG